MKTTRKILALGLALALAGAAACDAQGGSDRGGGMTDQQLRVMIDSLLPAIAQVSGMEVRHPVKFAMQSRADARTFLEGELDEELGPEGAHGMERAYKRFGLLPDTLDLRAMLLDLYEEQVVGYYDPATDRLYVLDEATPETAGPVVAHELVHALQDQYTNLDSLVASERGNDRQMAAQAAAEGQATLVMMGLSAARMSGRPIDLAGLPDLRPMMEQAARAENSQFPVYQRAPRLVKQTLIFPYVAGVGFLQALFRARGDSAPPIPFGDLLPQSTEQVMAPRARFLTERDAPTDITLGDPADGWTVVYANNLGQLETSILLAVQVGDDASGAAQGWDGDRYALLQGPDDQEALVWYSVWDDAGAADRFAETVRAARIAPAVERFTTDGREMVRLLLADSDAAVEAVPTVQRLTGNGN